MGKRFYAWAVLLLALWMLSGCGLAKPREYAGEAVQVSGEAVSEQPESVPVEEDGTETVFQETASMDTEPVLPETASADTGVLTEAAGEKLPEDGVYTSKEEVAEYLYIYGHLPSNFITKKEAEKLGWQGGSLEGFAPGKCIGGSRFGNYEGLLPKKEGRVYTECDIDTLGADRRGAKRIVFSNDGLIYYTEDHYETFTLLYGEE